MGVISTPIDAATTMGTVALTVSDLARSRAFYETVIGLRAHELDDGRMAMGVDGELALVTLRGDAGAPALNRRASGLFHLALLTPSRHELAHALLRIAGARWPLDGASDHLVSEALYLSDPDGNGIEIYRDRDRSEWPRDDNGELQMATLRLDLQDLAGELTDTEPVSEALAAESRMGHVHLQVENIARAEAFYHGVLGFDVTVRGYPGALFVSAGGYHHHLGLNTWNSAGSGPPAPGSVGLSSLEVRLPDAAELQRVLDRARTAGVTVVEDVDPPLAGAPTGSERAIVHDPSGIALVLRRP
jgi:catechol 2,3-dioxygenase